MSQTWPILNKNHQQWFGFSDNYLIERVARAVDEVPKLLSTTDIVTCDLGCGDMRATKLVLNGLKASGKNIKKAYCFDIRSFRSNENIEGFDAQCITYDLNRPGLPIADSCIDAAFSFEVIEHLNNPDNLFKEAHRILKKCGLLILTTPNMLAWYNRFLVPLGHMPVHYEISQEKKYGRGMRFGAENATVGHIQVFSSRALFEETIDRGFEIVHGEGLQFLYGGLKGGVDRFFKRVPNWASGTLVIARKL